MPDISKLSKFLKPDGCKDGDVITFVDAGKILTREFGQGVEKEEKEVFEVTVSLNGESKTYSPNATTRKILVKSWGTNTEKWVGKKARIAILPAPNGHDMIIAKPYSDAEAGSAKED
jgi:hypothetical protein